MQEHSSSPPDLAAVDPLEAEPQGASVPWLAEQAVSLCLTSAPWTVQRAEPEVIDSCCSPRAGDEGVEVSPTIRVVRKNNRKYLVERVIAIPEAERVDRVVNNIKLAMPTPAQKEAVEKYVRPSLERYGVQ